jgi:hypothetical protein
MQNQQNQVARHGAPGRRAQVSTSAEAHGYAGQVYEGTREAVGAYPLASVLVTFAAGFATGMLLATAFARPPRRPSPWQRGGNRLEELGRRAMDAVSGYAPSTHRRRW